MDLPIVYYLEEPTIGYCRECEETAIYTIDRGLLCNHCGNRNVSVFVWDKRSPHPEE